MNDYGIWVSPKNQEALVQDSKDSVFTSEFSTLKIFKRGHVSITTSGAGTGTAKILHGLGYPPTFYVWRKGTASYAFLDGSSYTNTFHPCPGTQTPWLSYHNTSDAYTDDRYLNIYIEGANSTTYNFVYYIFIDKAKYTDKEGFGVDEDYGIKISQEGYEADTAKEHEMEFSSRYRSMKYSRYLTVDYPNVTLPAISGDGLDTSPEEGTYVDFFHRLDYAPFFLAYYQASGEDERYMMPAANTGTLYGDSDFALTGWSDRSRIRLTFWRKAYYNFSAPSFSTSWSSSTLDFKLFIFLEDLGLQ